MFKMEQWFNAQCSAMLNLFNNIIIIIIIIISLFPYIDNKLHKSSISFIRFLSQVNIGKGEKAEAKLIISLPPSGVLEYKYKT